MSADYRRSLSSYATSRRSFLTIAAGTFATVAAGRSMAVMAFDGAYQQGKPIEGDYTFTNGTYVAYGTDSLYQYATGTDGYAYYNKNQGGSWDGWTSAGETAVGWDPAPVTYEGKPQAYYTGKDNYIYQVGWDSYGDPEWTDVSGGYTFEASPYASTHEGAIHLYGTSTDGYVYHKTYSDGAWNEWYPLNDAEYPAKTDCKPYSVHWGDHENTFWVGADDKVYWNRYSYTDGAWAGPKEIEADYGFQCTPYAVGYAPEEKLYAFSADYEGKPTWNTFVSGEGWSGWAPYEAQWAAKSQPNAYVAEEAIHVAYVADDGHGYYTQYGTDGWEGEWADLGDNYGYEAYQYSWNDGLYLTYTGENGGIYYKEYAFDGGGKLEPTEKPKY